jgi:dihydroorotate dehydrogenase (NAD+) catalytic subunit
VRSTGRARAETPVDLRTRVGSVELANPVMTASGTAGHGAELEAYAPLRELGATVVKSLAAYEWAGNPAPRVHPTTAGMINAVGLQGPGVMRWLHEELPETLATGALVIASIWGRSVDDYRRAAEQLAAAPDGVVAVEVNLSCPNLEGRRGIFAHDPALSAEVIRVTEACERPRWAKLSPNTDRIVEVAGAVAAAGAEAVTLVNTLLGMVLDTETGRPVLGAGGGGVSGLGLRPVAVRAVHDVRGAHPELPIVGVGGVTNGQSALELLLAGASAVQVGTATFADPRAPWRVLHELQRWFADRRRTPTDVIGAAHRGGLA